ncbi:MAG: hypothetical protein A2888_01130 [Chlamydiae bacterium RIFCSPLOWO2_01_FULL_28_7]|nr:MAG: hypothetical protein A2888_01130 [Chlamydiae bacterium RIFCSPLOWO2_01_FULL_28_7]
MNKLLEIKNLKVSFLKTGEQIEIIKNVNFSVNENEIVAFIGDSGSGKSITSLSILKLLDKNFTIEGSIIFEGEDILKKDEKEMLKIRGSKISIIFQDAFSYLNPTMRVGHQILEAIKKDKSKEKVKKLLEDAKIKNPEIVYHQYPHELSGGQRQRILIAIAIASNPKIIIADEPITSLDITLQIEILDLLKEIKNKYQTSIIYISHDMKSVNYMTDRIFYIENGKTKIKKNINTLLINNEKKYANVSF